MINWAKFILSSERYQRYQTALRKSLGLSQMTSERMLEGISDDASAFQMVTIGVRTLGHRICSPRGMKSLP